MGLKNFGLWKDLTFYFVLETQADSTVRAAQELEKLCADPASATERMAALGEIRQEIERLLQQFATRLDRAFITPLDKEDLDVFAQTLDSVFTAIESAAFHVELSHSVVDHHERGLAKLVVEASTRLHELAGFIRSSMKKSTMDPCLTSVMELERQGDRLYRAVLQDVTYRPGLDPRIAMLKKDTCQQIDQVLDRSAAVCVTIRRLAVKYG